MDKLSDFFNQFGADLSDWFKDSGVLGALAFFFLSLVVAWLVKKIFDRALNSWTKRTKTSIDEDFLKIIDRPLWQSIVLLGAAVAITWLKPGDDIQFVLMGAIKTAIVLIWSLALYRLSAFVFELIARGLRKSGRVESEFIPLLANMTRVVIIAVAILAILATWKINITPMLASAGLVGLAVALAARDTVANFFGGISIFMDRPYKIGDYINLDSGERGEVEAIGIRSTRIKTRDDIQIIVPNAIMVNSKIINESAPEPRFRVRIKVGVAYGSDLELVEKLLLEVAASNEMVVKELEPRARFRAFGDSGLEFELLCWIDHPMNRGRAIHELNLAVYNSFAKNGVTIPFPQRDLHLIPDSD